MVDGNVHLSSEPKEFVSPWHDLSSQDLDHFMEVHDTFQTEDIAHIVNPDEFTVLIFPMEIDKNTGRTKKRGRLDI